MRPVSDEFPISQSFGSLATEGVVGDMSGSQVQVLVAEYGNYQPYGHAGCDIACPVGTPVYAMRAGTVVWADWDVNLPGGPSGYSQRWYFYQSFGGRIILIQHDDGTFSDYCHLSEIGVTVGQSINEGDLIGKSGDSSGGRDGVLGPHLHTEYLVDTTYTTGNRLIYGRSDPTPLFGITAPAEQDIFSIMTATPEQQDAFIQRLLDHQVTQPDGGKNTLGELLAEYRGHHLDVLKTVGQVPASILNLKVDRGGGGDPINLGTVVSWMENWIVQVLGGIAALKTGAAPVDIEAIIKKAIAESIVTVDVKVEGTPKA
ncbi:M23 family metallopeptidase [Arthrobacter sp. NA-172]|uniref:M23 family metallopeptidase n=1 Tax=Arthrobacter sp. NA-172 TaxID=3367524 RepID=UPI003754424E